MANHFHNKDFWKRLYSLLEPNLKITEEDQKSGAIDRIIGQLLGRPINNSLGTKKLSKVDDYLRDLMYEYFEIEETIDQIRLAASLIIKFPSSFKKMSKIKYFLLIYGAYLNELYIYQLRVTKLITMIEKRCKKAGLFVEAQKLVKIKKWLNGVLDKVIKLRGMHVHQRRFKNTKIEQLEALNNFLEMKDFKDLHDYEYKKLRKSMQKVMSANATFLETLFHKEIGRFIMPIAFNDLIKIYKDQDILAKEKAARN